MRRQNWKDLLAKIVYKKSKNCIVLLLLFVAITQISAQTYTLKGCVTDDADKGPLPGAHVLIVGANATDGTACDDDGKYVLTFKKPEVTIRFQSLGYVSVEKKVVFKGTHTITLDVALKLDKKYLTNVNVQAKRYEITKDNSVASMDFVDAKHIEKQNVTNLEKAFDEVSGLVIVNGEPQMRGGSGFSNGMGSRVMIMMDEMPVMRVDAGRPTWNLIPMENVDQIEVLKGSASVLYGSAAITGAINVRTAYPKGKPEYKVSVYNGFYSRPKADYRCSWTKDETPMTQGASITHSRKIKKLDLVLSAEFAHDDGFVGQEMSIDSTNMFPELYKPLDKEKRARFNFGTRYNFREGVTAGLNGNFLWSKNTMTHFWLNADSGMYRTYPNSLTEMRDLMFFLDPFFKYYTKKEGSHTIKGRFMYSDNWATNEQDSKSQMYYVDYQFAKKFQKAGNLQLFVGATGQLGRSEGNVFSGVSILDTLSEPSPKYAVNGAIYVQLEKKFLKKQNLTLLAGGRFEYFRIFETEGLNDTTVANQYTDYRPVFRAGINYLIPMSYTAFRASFGQGYRTPTIGERYITLKVGNYGFYPNPDLVAETSWNVELGINQKYKLLGIVGMFDVAGYYQRYDNYVEFFMGPWLTAEQEPVAAKRYGFKNFNTGPAQIAGIDASLMGQGNWFNDDLKFNYFFAYSFTQPTVMDTDFIFVTTATMDYDYTNTSSDPENLMMKYRIEHVFKGDIGITLFDIFSVGGSVQYYSLMKNVDKFFYLLDRFNPDAPRWVRESKAAFPFDHLKEYQETHDRGTWVFGLNASVEVYNIKLTVLVENLFNKEYSLRPMAPEAPRLTTVRLSYKFKEGEPFFPKGKYKRNKDKLVNN
ncbi:MAG: TonB-dependent receptor [Bacteroidales bacterium]|jgi:iron complex outermembrane receptor protein|nr:TonB-dependent receptor [Bacteroidales bacterium]